MRRSRTLFAGGAAMLALVAASLAGGCAPSTAGPLLPMRVGYVASEDCLPLWVADRDGLFKDSGLDVRLSEYKTTSERDAALAGGQVDAIAGDIVVAARMRDAGTAVRIPTILLGATPEEGRYGIAVKPKSGLTSLTALAGKPVATSRGTLEEYVAESLMLLDGLGPAEIKMKAAPDVVARLEAVVSGQAEAALLPDPYLALAEQRGAKILSQDTHEVDLSIGVLVVSERFLDTTDGSTATRKLLPALTEASRRIDKDPKAYRGLLAERIPAMKPLAATYRVSHYPPAQLPALDDVETTLDWMTRSKLLHNELLYESLVWKPPAK